MSITTLSTGDEEIFLPEESRLINKSLKIREQIVDKILEDGIPTDNRKIRVINELLSAMDNLVLGKADRRLKKQENEDNGQLTEIVKTFLLERAKHKGSENRRVNKEVILDDSYQLEDIKPGEDSFEYVEITMEDIMDA